MEIKERILRIQDECARRMGFTFREYEETFMITAPAQILIYLKPGIHSSSGMDLTMDDTGITAAEIFLAVTDLDAFRIDVGPRCIGCGIAYGNCGISQIDSRKIVADKRYYPGPGCRGPAKDDEEHVLITRKKAVRNNV